MRIERDRQVVPDHHALAHGTRFRDKPPEFPVELRRPAGDVEDRDLRIATQNLQTPVDGFCRHYLGPERTRIHMAVLACLIAEFARVDLECLNVHRTEIELALAHGLFKVRLNHTQRFPLYLHGEFLDNIPALHAMD